MKSTTITAVALSALFATPTLAQLSSLESKDLRLIYFEGSESYLTPHAGRTFLNSMNFQRKLFSYAPTQKTTAILTDLADSGNAAASSLPRNFVSVQIAPLSFAFETLAANDRLNTIMNHELVHVVTMDQAAGRDVFFRKVFGGKVVPITEHPESILYLYLTAPRATAPRWFLEGIAVFIDTWMAGGLGRAQSGWDETVFRSMVRDQSRFYDPLGLVSEGVKIDFQGQINSYLYGARFMSYLAFRYSPEKLIDWASRHPGSDAYYANAFRQTFGLSIDEAWGDWVTHEKEFQQANLAAIRKYPLTKATDISDKPLGSVSRSFLDPKTRRLYAAVNYPGTLAHIAAISLDSGEVEKLADIKGPTIYIVASLAWDAASGMLFYSADNNSFRDLMSLDPKTKKRTLLIRDSRLGELVINKADRTLWGIRVLNGICTLMTLAPPYREAKQVFTWPYGEVPYDLDISPDGRLLSMSMGEISGNQSLRVYDLDEVRAGRLVPTKRRDFGPSVPSSFVFGKDSRSLYGTSYFTGVSNIFRFDAVTGAFDAMTNTDTGFIRPLPEEDSAHLLAYRFTGAGFIPTRLEAKVVEDINPITFFGERVIAARPSLKEWKLGSPAAIPFESMITKPATPYHLTRSLAFESAYPIVEGFKDDVALGVALNFSDFVQITQASIAASVSAGSGIRSAERFHARANFRRYDWQARGWYNGADFYDLFGPTKTSRKGYALGGGYKKNLFFDDPRKLDGSFDIDYFGNLERLPAFQNVVGPKSLLSIEGSLAYKNLRGSMGKVDDEKGVSAEARVGMDRSAGKSYPKVLGIVDGGLPLPLGHSSVFLRSAAGYAGGERSSPLASFYFGGFGNNWVDHRDEKRYRNWFAFPGLELNEIPGRSFVKSTLEWNLPPVRFSRAGRPGFYLAWARPAVFAGVLGTDFEKGSTRRIVRNLGGQIDFQLTVLSALDLTLSAGYARAFEDGRPSRHETMVSLKILH